MRTGTTSRVASNTISNLLLKISSPSKDPMKVLESSTSTEKVSELTILLPNLDAELARELEELSTSVQSRSSASLKSSI